MPRPALQEPRHHKASNRGIVRCKALFGSKPLYLRGPYKSPAMWEHWAEVQKLAERTLGQKATKRIVRARAGTIAAMFTAYYTTYCTRLNYQDKRNSKRALDVVAGKYGGLAPDDFDPVCLEECREAMVELGWSRAFVNRQVGKVRRAFKWAVTKGHCTTETYGALRLLEGLKRGWTKAPECAAVQSVEWPAVKRLLPFVPKIIADMLELHWLTGMRSGELVSLSTAEIERHGMTWRYVPAHHKKAWRGEKRTIYFGPKARTILKAYMHRDGFLFCPADAIAARYESRRSRLKPLPNGTHRKPPRIRKTRPHYTTASYNKAVRYGFIQLGRSLGLTGRPAKGQHVKHWLAPKRVKYFHPYQLRHSRATLTREAYGIEGSQAQLQDTFSAALVYAEKSDALSRRIAQETG